MNFEEDLVTLKEALAFIDSLDATELSDYSSSTDNDSNSNSNNPPAPSPQTSKKATRRATKRKRKRSTLSSSTRLQQRKKAEVLYLRKYAQELEEKRAKLDSRDQHASQGEVDAADDIVWMSMAKTHFQARLQSETTNRSLKTMLAIQAQVIDSLRNILHKQTSIQEMNLARVVEPSANVHLSAEINIINASLKVVSVAGSEYFDMDMPLV
ncbi:hypothetical protein DVH05_013260 [Phytophthora capsici]|nr:hypothetical protein DVH05_013260 [Phytophthora capsici]